MGGLPLLLALVREDLQLSYSQAGGLASAYLLVYAFMQLPAGYFSDRYSPRKLVSIGTLGLMSLSILLACSQQYWQLLCIQLLLGFFGSLMFTPSMSIFIRWFSPRHRSTATALPTVGVGIGFLAVNLLFPVIVNQFDTWRLPFIIFGVAGIIFAFGLFWGGKDTYYKGTSTRLDFQTIREVFRYKQVWLCYGLQFIRFSIVQGIGYWLPSLLVVEKGFPLQLAGIVIALQAVVNSPCNIFGAYLSDKYHKPIAIIAISMIVLGITTGLMVTLNSMVLIIAIVIVNAVFFQFYFGPLFTLAVEILGPEKTGISNGVSNMFAIFGGLITSYLMGSLKDSTGSFAWGFYSVCIISGIGLILTFILARVRHQNTNSLVK